MAAAHDAWRWLRDRVASVLSSLTVRGRVFEHRIRLRATRRCSRSTQRRRRRRACALCDGLRLAAHACTRSQVCTFQPSASTPPPKVDPDARPAVKGMDEFVAKQEAARKARAEALALEQEAAQQLLLPVAVPKEVYDSWKPFSVSDPERRKGPEERLKLIQAEVEKERGAACTFKPLLMATSPKSVGAAEKALQE